MGQLTPYQVRALYLCPRDKHGQVVTEGGEPGPLPTSEELFREHWRLQGLRDDQIGPLWAAQLEREREANAGAERQPLQWAD